ncbi:V-type ATP synthase subunit E [Chloroflexota bacterium]
MSEMEKIGEAILDKVKAEAQQLIREAEEKALEEIEKAEKQLEIRFEEEKRKTIEEARREADRILAEASIKARQELSKAKAEIIDNITSKVKAKLDETSSNETALLNLTKEAVGGLGIDKVRLYVSPKDINTVQGFLKKDGELANKIVEINKYDCSGGVIAEDIEGKLRIDNTYDTRLQMLLPQILPEIDRKLFEVS